jgi:tRNA-dihydrouridine synthase A
MMDRTDRHFRYLMRRISRRCLLYSEMVTTGAILFGDRSRHLDFHEDEHPLSLQLGGDDPKALAECARIAEGWGYDEVNLNVGCPSGRVQKGRFGACLMGQPDRVAECVAAMRVACSLPVTVKHRIGIDDLDRYEHMANFVETVANAGADRFSVHARKAWLRGLSPKQNRSVPPLRYDDVYRLKREFPKLVIEINGGITSLEQAAVHLRQVDAVMIGRWAYDRPCELMRADELLFGEPRRSPSRIQIVEGMLPYLQEQLAAGTPLWRMTCHMLNLFAGRPGARAWRRHLSEHSTKSAAGVEVVVAALDRVREPQRRSA